MLIAGKIPIRTPLFLPITWFFMCVYVRNILVCFGQGTGSEHYPLQDMTTNHGGRERVPRQKYNTKFSPNSSPTPFFYTHLVLLLLLCITRVYYIMCCKSHVMITATISSCKV